MSETSSESDNLDLESATTILNDIKISSSATAEVTQVKEQQQEVEALRADQTFVKQPMAQTANHDPFPSLDTLKLRTQKLSARLQQAQTEMSSQSSDSATIEHRAKQFMRIYVPSPSLTSSTKKEQRPQPILHQHSPTPIQAAPQRQLANNLIGFGVQHQQHQHQRAAPVVPMSMIPMQHFPYPVQSQNYALTMSLATQMQLQRSTLAASAALPQAQRRPKKNKKALSGEITALIELVQTLATISPEVNARAQLLINQNKVLSQLDWPNTGANAAPQSAVPPARLYGNTLPGQPGQATLNPMRRIDGGSEQPQRQILPQQAHVKQHPQHHQHYQQHHNGRRSRRESERSSTSNSSALPVDGSAASQSPRKRKRNRKNRDSGVQKNTPRTLATELESMRAYINRIVQNYAGAEQLLPRELLFTGDFSDLEEYAQRLVAAGYGRIVEDEIRVNRKNNRHAFITMSNDRETLERDGIVLLPVARRYAFEGDTVRAFVLNVGASVSKLTEGSGTITGGNTSLSLAEDEELSDETESQDSDADNVAVITSDNCPKAFVISIIKQTELRQIVGTISFTNPTKLSNDNLFYKFRPHDLRVPMVYVAQESCAKHIGTKQPEEVCGLLYLAHILETDCNGHCIAELLQPVGRVGNLEDEKKAILIHNGLRDIVPFEERFNEMFAKPGPPPNEKDLKGREDLRKNCIFTIDPLTARDLDDALSIEKKGDNCFEVGVHISDVSHYLPEDSELDNIVKQRSTSIYLANEVIHMLPQPLCLRCSLLPGEDKYTFSVFWQLNGNGEMLNKPRFTRSIINSCTQFAYEHAQKFIDNPREDFNDDEFPTILNGFGVQDVMNRVLWLHGIASNMRKQRFVNGALTINNAKLRFTLDPISGEPEGFEVEQQREANRMIEEFMLLANQAVARFIHDRFPNIAVLRNHAPPLTKSMKALREKLLPLGYDLDYSSSKAVQESMVRICSMAPDPVAMSACLSQLLMKPMARAKYFCSDGKTDEADLWHYALSIPIYTHFTSPIRRYPDILVHRLLAAALNYCPAPMRTPDELSALTKTANERKYNAKSAGDDSSNLYFKRYVKNKQIIYMRAVVIEIFQHMLNVVTLESGHVVAIKYKMQKLVVDTQNAPNFILISERNSKMPPAKVQLLSVVTIRLTIWDNKLTGFLVDSRTRRHGAQNEVGKWRASSEQPSAGAASYTNTSAITKTNQQKQQASHSKGNSNSNSNKNTASTNHFHGRIITQSNNNVNNNSNNSHTTQSHGHKQRVFAMRQDSL
ncbi:DIS3-like exonuclease 2 [Scaptodrosophila lebanonensis]|uniref:DIS3-like exonuclease 2 n=1 Tax=Drosophila lebanonensis TaxID=7225 RepID=A0A6J2UBF2_DROLE|nr:DIS3-like exonuclease 2 [Scaptodrosophila lebanonensis]